MSIISEKMGYFFAGMLLGGVLAYRYVTKEYEEKMNEQKRDEEELKKMKEETQATVERCQEALKKYQNEAVNPEKIEEKVEEVTDKNMNKRADFEYISMSQFADNELEYDQSDITYYEEEGCFVEKDSVMEEIDELFPPDVLKHLGDGDTLYLRNNLIHVEYAITSESGTFRESDW